MSETATQTIELTAERARELMREAVAEKGEDYVYQRNDVLGTCDYLEYEGGARRKGAPTGPSCIVGHVLVRAGVPMGALVEREGAGAFELAVELAGAPRHVAQALEAAQRLQDTEATWGRSLSEFEAVVGA